MFCPLCVLLIFMYMVESRPSQNDTGAHSWLQTIRGPGQVDSVIATECNHLDCGQLFLAESSAGDKCRCECPKDTPVFLHSIGQCIKTIEACPRPLRFEKTALPVVTLPPAKTPINVHDNVLWTESSVKVKKGVGARCNVTSVEFLGRERTWIEIGPELVELGWTNGTATIIWNGDHDEHAILAGTILLVRLDCVGNYRNAHCVALRIRGVLDRKPVMHEERRAELMIIILLVILLLFTVAGSALFWNVCWKVKKQELIAGLQLQFLYHLSQQAQPNEHPPNVPSPTQSRDNPPLPQPLLVKRKLFFSPEFFEPQYMKNPPMIADQFRQDLRAMISLARQRIQQQRHVPTLSPIHEEPPDEYQPYMKVVYSKRTPASIKSESRRHKTNLDTTEPPEDPKHKRNSDTFYHNQQLLTSKPRTCRSKIPVNTAKSPRLHQKFALHPLPMRIELTTADDLSNNNISYS